MTIDSTVYSQTFNVSASKKYTFTFENIGPGTIYVYAVNDAGDLTLISTGSYDLTYTGEAPVYDGGVVETTAALPSGTVQITILRDTPVTQNVDLEPYTPFPAETVEFALDKLTLIQQEQGKGEGGTGGGGGGLDPNSFIPISGTKLGAPITGIFQRLSGSQNYYDGLYGAGLPGFWISNASGVSGYGNPSIQLAVNMGGKITFFNSYGEWLVETDYDRVGLPSNVLVTKQWVEDNYALPGAAFIPLAGNTALTPVTSFIYSQYGTTGVDLLAYAYGTTSGLGVAGFIIGPTSDTEGDSPVVIAAGTAGLATEEFWVFSPDGTLLLPDIDYSMATDLDAVNKKYVDDAVAGGGTVNTFLKLAGTDPGFPIKGTVQTNYNGYSFETAILSGVGAEGFTIYSSPTSPVGSNINLISDGFNHAVTGNRFISPGIQLYDADEVFGTRYDLFIDGAYGVEGFYALPTGAGGAFLLGATSFGGAPYNLSGAVDGTLKWDGLRVNIGAGAHNAAYELSVIGEMYSSAGLATDGTILALSATLTNGATGAEFLMTAAQKVQPGSATRKDYVDGLNSTNVKTTGNQTNITGEKTWQNEATFGAAVPIRLPSIAPPTGGYLKVTGTSFGSGMFAETTLAAVDVEVTPGVNLVSRLGDLQTQLSAAQTKLANMRAAFDGVADIMNATPPQKAQIATLLNSLGIT